MDYFLLDSFENIRNLTPAEDIYSPKIIFLFVYINGDIYQQTYYIKDLINLYYFIKLKSGDNNKPKYIGFLLPKQMFDNVVNKEIFLLNEIKKSPLIKEMELILRINLSKNNYIIKQINYNDNDNDIKQEYFNFSFLLKEKEQIDNINDLNLNNSHFNNNKINNSSNNIYSNDSKDLEISNLKKIVEKQKLEIKDLQDKLNNKNNLIESLQSSLNQKEIELNELKNKLINSNNNLNNYPYNKIKIERNKMMCVNFISTKQNLHFAVPCADTDTFAEVEEKLYKQFPEYREKNNNFIAQGKIVLRFKTIAENNIGSGFPVTLVDSP